MDFSNINYLAVIVAAVAGFALGSLWYSSILFGKTWQSKMGFTDDDLKDANMAKIFGSSLLLMLVMSLGMGMLIQGHFQGEVNLVSGLKHGLYIGIVFVSTSMGINMLYQRKSFTLWLIDGGYQVLILTLMGAVLGAWK